jgi:hypothetical protein
MSDCTNEAHASVETPPRVEFRTTILGRIMRKEVADGLTLEAYLRGEPAPAPGFDRVIWQAGNVAAVLRCNPEDDEPDLTRFDYRDYRPEPAPWLVTSSEFRLYQTGRRGECLDKIIQEELGQVEKSEDRAVWESSKLVGAVRLNARGMRESIRFNPCGVTVAEYDPSSGQPLQRDELHGSEQEQEAR